MTRYTLEIKCGAVVKPNKLSKNVIQLNTNCDIWLNILKRLLEKFWAFMT
jgi:hypothetical protein